MEDHLAGSEAAFTGVACERKQVVLCQPLEERNATKERAAIHTDGVPQASGARPTHFHSERARGSRGPSGTCCGRAWLPTIIDALDHAGVSWGTYSDTASGPTPPGPQPLLWKYVGGTQAATVAPTAATIVLDGISVGAGAWPIPTGSYIAYYLRGDTTTSLASIDFDVGP